MAYFAPYIDESGLHLPTYTDRIEALCAAYRSIFGADAALTEASPDYQLLSVFARALDDVSALALQTYNARNPAYAQGQSLDLLLPQYGLTRRPATFSQADLTFTVSAAITIPLGTMVADTAGRVWLTTEAVSASGAGTVIAPAACRQSGQIYAAAGTINSLVSPLSGVTSVTNASGSTVGQNAETDAEARVRLTTAMTGRGSTIEESLAAAIAALPYVRSSALYVNDSNAADSRGIPAHAIAAVVYMGMPNAIAQAIFDGKAPGISTYGSTSGTATDAFGQTHTVYFSRPTTRLLYVSVSLKPLTGYDSACQSTLRAAILSWIKARPIGKDVIVTELYGVCYAALGPLATTLAISAISVSTTGAGAATYTDVVPLDWNQNVDANQAGITFREV